MQRRVAAGAGILHDKALKIAIAGLAQGGVHADIRGAAGEQQMGDAMRPQHAFQYPDDHESHRKLKEIMMTYKTMPIRANAVTTAPTTTPATARL